MYFNPQGPRGPRLVGVWHCDSVAVFQSTRPSRASTDYQDVDFRHECISIHKALAGLDWSEFGIVIVLQYFNPQGPRGPRPLLDGRLLRSCRFQSTRPSRASTPRRRYTPTVSPISIHKALAGLDDIRLEALTMEGISIHKALAGLDEERIP